MNLSKNSMDKMLYQKSMLNGGWVMRKFEEFTGRATPVSSKTMRVAIQRRGTISMNRAAFKALGEPETVTLLFDAETNAIGLKPSTTEVRHSYPVRKQPNSSSYLFAAQAFCKFYEIDVSVMRAFEPTMEDGIMVIELDKGVEIAPRPRKPKGEQTKEPELAFS